MGIFSTLQYNYIEYQYCCIKINVKTKLNEVVGMICFFLIITKLHILGENPLLGTMTWFVKVLQTRQYVLAQYNITT